MGALKIDCYLNETQMENIVKFITSHLTESDRCEIADIDETIGDVRVCVEFNAYLDNVSIVSSEILDIDWDVLEEDTAVLKSRLKPVINNYNNEQREAVSQALGITADQTW